MVCTWYTSFMCQVLTVLLYYAYINHQYNSTTYFEVVNIATATAVVGCRRARSVLQKMHRTLFSALRPGAKYTKSASQDVPSVEYCIDYCIVSYQVLRTVRDARVDTCIHVLKTSPSNMLRIITTVTVPILYIPAVPDRSPCTLYWYHS